MAVQTPTTWTAGDDATSTKLQTVTDAVLQLQGGAPTAGALDFCLLARDPAGAAVALTANVAADVQFTAGMEYIDAANGHDTTTNPNRYVGKTPGWYSVAFSARFAANASGARQVLPYQNGILLLGDPGMRAMAAPSGSTGLGSETVTYLNGTTDYVSLVVLSTVAVNLEGATLFVRWLRS